ncbi:uncharacterized protein LOC135484863 [Lineus longissimus]|uniref:uncharacterized protein LOC135484863 n=1 Tax=Lineus longissimus TaxID=88925 RepID=UPI00315C69FC
MIQLTIEMTERKDIYSSIKVLMCLASSKPLLNDPRGNVMLLMEEGCPVSDNIAHFTADPTDKRIVSTSLFPIVAFDGSEVFYHCAVSVCRWDDDCAPSTCRVRRSVVQEYGQNDGAFKYGDSDVYSIISPVIRVRRSSGQGTDETGAKYKECTDFFGMGLCKKSTGDIISVTMIGGVACLVIVMLLGVTYWYWRKTGTLEMEQLLEEDDFADGASSFIEMYLQGLDPGIPDFIDVTEMDPGSSEVFDGYEDDMRF